LVPVGTSGSLLFWFGLTSRRCHRVGESLVALPCELFRPRLHERCAELALRAAEKIVELDVLGCRYPYSSSVSPSHYCRELQQKAHTTLVVVGLENHLKLVNVLDHARLLARAGLVLVPEFLDLADDW
jgi:hypothetical protein